MFDAFCSSLSAYDYNTTVIKLPSTDPLTPLLNVEDDVVAVKHTVAPLVAKGRDVLLVVHASGSLSGCEAVKNLTRNDRLREGKIGGVMGLVFMAGFLLKEGQCLSDAKADPTLWHTLDSDVSLGNALGWDRADCQQGLLTVPDPHHTFFNDLPDLPALCLSPYNVPQTLPRQSPQLFKKRASYEAWRHIPSVFISPQQDNAIPLSDTRRMIEDAEGVVAVIECEGSHCPWLSVPELVMEVVREAAGENISSVSRYVPPKELDPKDMFTFLRYNASIDSLNSLLDDCGGYYSVSGIDF